MKRLILVASFLFVVLGSTSASAQRRNQDIEMPEGLYGRFNFNSGYMLLDADGFSVNGMGMGFSFAGGYEFADTLALFADFSFDFALKPGGSVDNSNVDPTGESLSFLTIGPGIAYYLPSNLYAQAMFGFMSASVGADGFNPPAATGFFFRLGAGREWFVSERFSLGAGGNFLIGSVSESGVDAMPLGIGATFAGTYH